MRKSIGTVAALSMAATAFVAPALADKILSAAEAHKMLAGRQFEFVCVDGTRGQASYATSGVATASYRLPSRTAEETGEVKDEGRVRTSGENLCIRWNNLNAGEEGCFRMTERRPGQYRIATEDRVRWCDLSVRGTL